MFVNVPAKELYIVVNVLNPVLERSDINKFKYHQTRRRSGE